jgi:cobalt-zinc-cadmium efflux system membrane fusion protein
MPLALKSILSLSARVLPVLLTTGVLAGVGVLGLKTGWKMPPAAEVFGAPAPSAEGWCRDHGAPEATCVVCRGLKVTSSPPSKRVKGEPALIEPPVEGKLRPVVQLPNADVLRVAGVQTAPAEVRLLVETVEANAESGYDMTRYAQVGARVPGFASLVRAKAGQKVKKGDVLCLVDSAEVGKAKAELLQAAASLATKRAVLERVKTSTAAGFRNQADQMAAEAEVREAGIRLFNARQALTSLGLPVPEALVQGVPNEKDVQFLGLPPDIIAGLEPAKTTSNLLPVMSPLDGLIVSQAIVPGELVDPSRPLFVVADTSRMWITAELSPGDAAKIRVGLDMAFRPDGVTGELIVGAVSWISTEVSEKTRTVQVRAEVANPDGHLRARMFGRVSITVASKSSALTVPIAAVQPDGNTSFVFVRLNEEVYRPRVVTLGGSAGLFVEILSGLSAGETVATQGSYFLAAQANRGKLGAGCCAND